MMIAIIIILSVLLAIAIIIAAISTIKLRKISGELFKLWVKRDHDDHEIKAILCEYCDYE